MDERARVVETFRGPGGELRIELPLPRKAGAGEPPELCDCVVSVRGQIADEYSFVGGDAFQAGMQALLGIHHLLIRQRALRPDPASAEVHPSEGPFLSGAIDSFADGHEIRAELALGWPCLLPLPPGPAWVCLTQTRTQRRRGKRSPQAEGEGGPQSHAASSPLLALIAGARALQSVWQDHLLWATDPVLGRTATPELHRKTAEELRALFESMRSADTVLDAVLANYEGRDSA